MRPRLIFFIVLITAVGLSRTFAAEPAEGGTASNYLSSHASEDTGVDFDKNCPTQAASVTSETAECRTITGADLVKLLRDKSEIARLSPRGLKLVGATIDGGLDLSGMTIEANIACSRCTINGPLKLDDATSKHGLTLSDSSLSDGLSGQRLHLDGILKIVETKIHGGPLNLSSATLPGGLGLTGGKIYDCGADDCQSVKLDGADIANVSIAGVELKDGLSLDDTVVKSGVRLTGRFGGKGLVAHNAQIGGELKMHDATIGGFHVESSHVGGGLTFAAGVVVDKDIDIEDTQVDGAASFADPVVGGDFLADGLGVKKGLTITGLQGSREKHKLYTPQISMNRANVGGDLTLEKCLAKLLQAQKIKVGGSLYIRSSSTDDALDLKAASIGADLEISTTTVGQNLELNQASIGKQIELKNGLNVRGAALLIGAQVGGDVLIGNEVGSPQIVIKAADFGLMTIASNLFVHNAKFEDSPALVGADIKGHLDITGADLPGLDLTRAWVHGDFRLAGASETHPGVAWRGKAALKLRNAHVGVVQDENDGTGGTGAWPPQIELEGFVFDRFGKDPPLAWARDWLGQRPFATSSYQHFARYYTDGGATDRANMLLHDAKLRETDAAWENCIRDTFGACAHAVVLSAMHRLIGYGIGNGLFQALYWVVGMTLLGTLVIARTRLKGQIVWWHGDRYRSRGALWCVGASLNQLIPIVELNKEFKDYFYDPDRERLSNFQLIYFAFHALMGYVLASFVLAGIAGLTQNH